MKILSYVFEYNWYYKLFVILMILLIKENVVKVCKKEDFMSF